MGTSVRVCLALVVSGVMLSSCRAGAPVPSTTPTPVAGEAVPTALRTPKGLAVKVTPTGELDEYDKTARFTAEASRSEFGVHTVVSDNFAGSDRRAAKLSIVKATAEVFSSVEALVKALPTDQTMLGLGIPRGKSSGRVQEERRRVALDALLCAASREDDNDFHLIVCDPVEANQGRECFNVEVSGLPKSGTYRAPLQKARETLAQLLRGELPGSAYDRYDPAIPVAVTGSLFYDVSHKPGVVGPSAFKPKTAWEIHPVESIVER